MSPQHIHLPHPVHFPVSEKSDLILEDTPDLHPYAPDYYSAAGILPAADSAVERGPALFPLAFKPKPALPSPPPVAAGRPFAAAPPLRLPLGGRAQRAV